MLKWQKRKVQLRKSYDAFQKIKHERKREAGRVSINATQWMLDILQIKSLYDRKR